MKVVKTCVFCEMSLIFEQDGKTYEFIRHDDEMCKLTMRHTIHAMRDALKSQAEVMARACVDFGASQRPCSCGERRREITEPGDELFAARTGCLCCGKWDGPVVFK